MNTPFVRSSTIAILVVIVLFLSGGCASRSDSVYVNPLMDFGAVRTVAVLPFLNLATDEKAAGRVRDEFMNRLLATEALYVLPPGEVARGINRAGLANPSQPSIEEIKKLSGILNVEAVITGVLREYGTVRSGSSSANLISLSLQMIETQAGTTIWSSTSTVGGIDVWDRLFGGGGRPMNDETAEAVNDLIDKLFE